MAAIERTMSDSVELRNGNQLAVASERAYGILLFPGHKLFGPAKQNGKCRTLCDSAKNIYLCLPCTELSTARNKNEKQRSFIGDATNHFFYLNLSKHSMGIRSNARMQKKRK